MVARDHVPPAVPLVFSGQTADVTLLTGVGSYKGFVLQGHNRGAVTVNIFDSEGATDRLIGTAILQANQSSQFWLDGWGLRITNGIFLNVVSGSADGSIFVIPSDRVIPDEYVAPVL